MILSLIFDYLLLSEVNKQGLVCGKAVGEISLIAKLFGGLHNHPLSTDAIVVKVVLATGIRIHLPSSVLIVGSVTEVYATLTNDEEDIHSGQAIARMKWESDDSSVLSTHSIYRHEPVRIRIHQHVHSGLYFFNFFLFVC